MNEAQAHRRNRQSAVQLFSTVLRNGGGRTNYFSPSQITIKQSVLQPCECKNKVDIGRYVEMGSR